MRLIQSLSAESGASTAPARLRDLALILVLAALVLLPNLGRPLETVEAYWADIVLGIYDSGDLFTLKIGSWEYYDKPYLSYWVQLLSAGLAGGVSETSLRLPSVAAALGSLVIVYRLALQWFGRRVALIAPFILLTTATFIGWATNAETEMPNLAAILLLIWVFFRYKDSDSNLWLYGLTTLMAVASWIKGPLGYTVPGTVMLLHSLAFRDWKWFRVGHVLIAGSLSLILYLSLFVLSWYETGHWGALYAVYQENLLRLFAPFDHVKPRYFYLLAI